MLPFRFGVHASVAPTMPAWRQQAQLAEELGYSALYLTDHLDNQFGPLVAATIAAEATTTLTVGTLVLNNDLRNPVILAKEIATLALAAEGRVEIGLGAGWLRAEYDEVGIPYDEPSRRVGRLSESLAIMAALWSEGEVNFDGEYYSVHGARCEPRSVTPPKVIVGGGSKGILTLAAKRADVIGINASLSSGEKTLRPRSDATSEHFDRCVTWVRDAAGDRFGSLEFQLTAFSAMVVASRRAAVRSATMLGYEGEDALSLPSVLIGTEDELCERLVSYRERWGVSNVVVPEASLEAFAPIVDRLATT